MEHIWIFACFIVIFIKPYLSNDVRHDVKSLHWSQASGDCGNDGLEFNESILKRFDVLQGTTFWIGKAIYKKTLDWIEILGCYEVKDPIGMTVLSKTSSVAECQFRCKSVMFVLPLYFGYNDETQVCICARQLQNYTAPIQDCAGKNYPNDYFFYQVYTGKVIAGLGHCTTLSCSTLSVNNKLRAADCLTTNARRACGNEQIMWGLKYSDSLNWCMSKGHLLLAPSNYCLTHIDEGIVSWTNVFRLVKHYQVTKAEVGNENPLQCFSGQLVKHDGEWKLNETKRDCSNGLHWYLCRNATVKFNTSANTDYVPSKSPMTSNKRVGTTLSPERLSSTIHSIASPGVTNYSAHPKHQIDDREQGSNSKKVGTVIGGLLGACSVIALLTGLIICKVRSIGVFTKPSKHLKQETSRIDFSKATYQDSNNTTNKINATTTANETYGLASNSTAVYAVVNKIKTPKTSNEIYTDAAYGQYDHLNDIQNRKMCQQENVYHSHRLPQNGEDQTYDSSDFGVGKSNGGQDLYDQSFTVVEEEYSYSTNKIHDNTNDMNIYDKSS